MKILSIALLTIFLLGAHALHGTALELHALHGTARELHTLHGAAQTPHVRTSVVPVFVSGTEGYRTFRIPALIRLPSGDLLAFAEGRRNGMADFGHIDIVMKRSTDLGRTWSPLQVAASNDTLQAGNPAPVVDNSDPAYPKGRIFLFYNTGNASEGMVRNGKGYRQAWYKTSADGGVTWSDPVNITTQVHRPLQPAVNPAWDFKEDWRSCSNTPGHAIQFGEGLYKGRLFVAANHSEGPPQPHFQDYHAHGYYTDDHGKTFHLSETVQVPGSNEVMAAALPGNGLMMNMRNQRGDVRARIVALSKDGGETWDSTYMDLQLPDPVCQGSLLALGEAGRGGHDDAGHGDVGHGGAGHGGVGYGAADHAILAFCNDASTHRRDSLTLRISYDEGRTWPKSFLIDDGERQGITDTHKDPVAYSDMADLGRHRIGILYERENYAQIGFTVQRW